MWNNRRQRPIIDAAPHYASPAPDFIPNPKPQLPSAFPAQKQNGVVNSSQGQYEAFVDPDNPDDILLAFPEEGFHPDDEEDDNDNDDDNDDENPRMASYQAPQLQLKSGKGAYPPKASAVDVAVNANDTDSESESEAQHVAKLPLNWKNDNKKGKKKDKKQKAQDEDENENEDDQVLFIAAPPPRLAMVHSMSSPSGEDVSSQVQLSEMNRGNTPQVGLSLNANPFDNVMDDPAITPFPQQQDQEQNPFAWECNWEQQRMTNQC